MTQIKVFADGHRAPDAEGYTLNPTLAKAAGVHDYRDYARQFIATGKPVSVEILDETIAYDQALRIAGWGDNVAVKIPCLWTDGSSSSQLVMRLAREGVRVNVTALCTREQIRKAALALASGQGGYLSVFAGRIADVGHDPVPLIDEALKVKPFGVEVIWASCREAYNVIQACHAGCDVITVPEALWGKVKARHRPLELVALDTVRQFAQDATGLRA